MTKKTASKMLLLSGLIASLLLSGCCRPPEPSLDQSSLKAFIGESCRVQIDRRILGASRELPVSPTTSAVNGADTSVYGKLVKVDRLGLTLQLGTEEEARYIWIPQSSILLVDFP